MDVLNTKVFLQIKSKVTLNYVRSNLSSVLEVPKVDPFKFKFSMNLVIYN